MIGHFGYRCESYFVTSDVHFIPLQSDQKKLYKVEHLKSKANQLLLLLCSILLSFEIDIMDTSNERVLGGDLTGERA